MAMVNENETPTHTSVQKSACLTESSAASRCRTLRSSTSSVRNSTRNAAQTSWVMAAQPQVRNCVTGYSGECVDVPLLALGGRQIAGRQPEVERNGARHVDRREGAHDHADRERGGKPLQDVPAEEQQRQHGPHGGLAGHPCARQGVGV